MIKVKSFKNLIFFVLLGTSILLCLFLKVSLAAIFLICTVCIINFCVSNFEKDNRFQKTIHKQRETYISTLSHDLKIPTLAQIRALDLLLDENVGKINKEQREIINLTLESCNFMYDMLSTILDTYKYENREVNLNFEKTLVYKLVDDCFTKTNATLQSKNIHIRIKAKDEFSIISADRLQIKKAFENLIGHCVSCAYENTDIVCEIKKSYDEKKINISLIFESPYITAQGLKNMLNMYNTPADKLDKVGSGLGLYLAKKIIEAHDGSIEVQSMGLNYSIYDIVLPCCVNDCKIPAAAV